MATRLDLSDAQFIGFNYGKRNGTDIIGLIKGMGLTKNEWKQWKQKYPSFSLNESEIEDIDNHFNLKK